MKRREHALLDAGAAQLKAQLDQVHTHKAHTKHTNTHTDLVRSSHSSPCGIALDHASLGRADCGMLVWWQLMNTTGTEGTSGQEGINMSQILDGTLGKSMGAATGAGGDTPKNAQQALQVRRGRVYGSG